MTTPLDGVAVAVLAGGLGTRLRSVVADRPKVLAPVAGRPFLAHLLDQLRAAGASEVVLLVGHGADQVRAAFGDEYDGVRLAYSAEPHPLGTGGAVRHALPLLTRPTVLLMNGDSYCDVDFAAFRGFHRARGAKVSLALTRVEDAARYGRVEYAPGDHVERFAEKRADAGPGWINAGVYLLNRDLIETLPAEQPVSLERDALPAWVAEGGVFGFPGGGWFIDIGVPDSYAAAQTLFRAPGERASRAGRR